MTSRMNSFQRTVSALLLTCCAVSGASADYRLLSEPPGFGGRAEGHSFDPKLSRDGSVLLFSSRVGALANPQLIVRELDSENRFGPPTVVLPEANGVVGTAVLSGDGKWIGFTSNATNLHPGSTATFPFGLFLLERATGEIEHIALQPEESAVTFGLSFDGSHLLVSLTDRSDRNQTIYSLAVYDRRSRELTRLVSDSARVRDARISDDGQVIALTFSSDTELGLRLIERQTGRQQVLFASTLMTVQAISSAGARLLLTRTTATGLTELILLDRATMTVEVIGNAQQRGLLVAQMSGDGRFILFVTANDTIVAGDVNGGPDFFLFDAQENSIQMLRPQPDNSSNSGLALSDDASVIVVASGASNFVSNDTNGFIDVFRFIDGPGDQAPPDCDDEFPQGIWRSESGVSVQVAGSPGCRLGPQLLEWGEPTDSGLQIPGMGDRPVLNLFPGSSFEPARANRFLLDRYPLESGGYYFATWFVDPATGYHVDMTFVANSSAPRSFELLDLVVSEDSAGLLSPLNRFSPVYAEYATRWEFEEGGTPAPAPDQIRLAGTLWRDQNGDGMRGTDEPTLAGQSVALFRCGDADGLAGRQSTDGGGAYSFDALPPAQFQIGITLAAGERFAPQRLGADGELLSLIRAVSIGPDNLFTGFSDCRSFEFDRVDLDVALEVLP